ncbi:GerMN domain-containing protein [Plantactinospora sp. WMMC1484]|uniref:GerMN domain-containing protein n=1 Tax=Plantactinospora sp. WMMC1484 TaxID=3404122 RepID=UPI003BF4EB8F
MNQRRPVRPTLVLPLLLGLVVGCQVPVEETPRPIDSPPGVTVEATRPTPQPTRSGVVVERLYYLRDDKLVPVTRRLPDPLPVDAHLQLLLAGPAEVEQRAGLTSAVTGSDTVLGVEVADGEAVVEVGAGLAGTGRNDEILAFGQIVQTLTARPDVDRVTFRQGGEHLGIPRADGALSRAPLTTQDYSELTVPG